ncbi:MAG: putative peptidase and in,kexin, sedolisin family, partial [Marmoricola sp.]|nr:putative peptidase and in,kexin, sedolisin family [Marmoricola sp.]
MASTDLIRDAVDAASDRRYPGTTAQPAVNADVIVLAAAGNCIGLVVWLARSHECIAVARVDISAPAEKAWRATVPNGSGQGQGTSLAVAPAAGPAARWLHHHGQDPFSMGAGIVDGPALLSVTDFELDRERESAAAAAGLRENAAPGVASF